MAYSGDPIECLKEGVPFLPQWSEPSAPGRCEAVVTTVAACVIRLPIPLDPATPLHFIKQEVERGERKPQGSGAAFVDLLRNFEPIKGLFCQQGKDGQFRASPRDL